MTEDNKLKTLKDLENEFKSKYSYEDTIVDSDTIRDEAIKWIKALRKATAPELLLFTKAESDYTINWIKYFFDISEEDLK